MTTFKDCAPEMWRNGYEVLPIKVGEKRPAIDDWADIELTKDLMRSWYANGVAQGGAGIRLGNGVLALDIDVDDVEVCAIVQDCAELVLGGAPSRIGRAPRVAMLYQGKNITKKVMRLISPIGELHKVELLGKGQQVVAFGVHPDTGNAYQWVDQSPVDVAVDDLELIDADLVSELFTAIEGALPEGWRTELVGADAVSVDDELIAFVEHNPDRLDLTDAEVEAAIDAYSVPSDYDGWLRFLLACYHQSGGTDLGREWAHRGCRSLDNYDKKEIDAKWRSGTLKAKGDRKPVTFATVLAEVGNVRREVAVKESMSAVEKIRKAIQNADEAKIRGEIVSKIKKVELDPLDLELVAKSMQARLKELVGVSFPIAKIRGMLTKSGGRVDAVGETPDWCVDWVYVNTHDGFFNLDERQIFKHSGFNVKCGRNVPASENGNKPSAVKYVSDNGFVDDVAVMAYLPGIDDAVLTLPNGVRAVNTYSPASVPVACDSISADGLVAVDVVRRHLRVLCGSENEALILEQWLAHQVQFPGVKLLWVPLIQSIQGIGKSYIAELLNSVLGSSNVGVVAPSQVVSDFNGWATGVCVNVLEELKISGHNRHEVANALKPLITDRFIQVVDKHVKAHKTINTTNYICFTNHRDAVPLEDEDRRWWVIFCQIESTETIGDPFGLTKADYFNQLWDSLRGHNGCLRRWLLDYQISDEFKGLINAPKTIYKDAMMATERASFEHLDELQELIDLGGANFNKHVICAPDLFAAAEFEIDGFEANTSRRALMLKRLGYSQMPYRLKIDGNTKRVWCRQVLSIDEARDMLHPVPF
jgi:hypothetical protein